MIEELKARAADHWREWLPKKWAELLRTDSVDLTLNIAARHAEKEIRELMDSGARLDEAEEMVLPQWILLKPEKQDDEETSELAESEAAYQSRMRQVAPTPDL